MKWILVAALSVLVGTQVPVHAKTKASRGPASAEERSTISDVVKKLRDDDEGVVVNFEKASGSYYLRRDAAGFDGIKKKLEQSMTSKKPVSVTVESSQLNILDVK